MVLSIESKVRELCISRGFTLGGKGLNIIIHARKDANTFFLSKRCTSTFIQYYRQWGGCLSGQLFGKM